MDPGQPSAADAPNDAGWFQPYMETFTSTKLAFAETGAMERFAEFPDMEAYKWIMERCGEWEG